MINVETFLEQREFMHLDKVKAPWGKHFCVSVKFSRVDYNLEYEDLEKFNLEFILISKISVTFISKKNDGNLEFNLEKVNLEKAVGNLI